MTDEQFPEEDEFCIGCGGDLSDDDNEFYCIPCQEKYGD
jgi:hypothetical protein